MKQLPAMKRFSLWNHKRYEILEIESNKLNESDTDPFETDYSLEILYGKMDQESCHKMVEGDDQIDTPLFSDKGFFNKDWNKYTCISHVLP